MAQNKDRKLAELSEQQLEVLQTLEKTWKVTLIAYQNRR